MFFAEFEWVTQWVWVFSQRKHTLRDGKSLAGYFSCCRQRFPWQVSLNRTFVCTCFFFLSLYLLLINFSFPEDTDWSPMTRSWLKTSTKPCESKLHTKANDQNYVVPNTDTLANHSHRCYLDTLAAPKIAKL